MKRFIFILMSSAVLIAAAPATSLARSHHKKHRSHHHKRVTHKSFGSDPTPGGGGSEANAGTIDSFTNGTLTIRLADGHTLVSGQVTSGTELECEMPETMIMETGNHDGGGSSGGGDHGSGGGDDGTEAEHNCPTTALTPGTVVKEAELRVSSAGAVWEKVELVTP